MSGFFSLRARYRTYLLLAAVLVVLYLARLRSYLLFHSLGELFSVIVAAGIFVITWNSRRYFQNGALLWLGLAYLFVAAMDTLHTLAYRGMGVFPNVGTDLATQLWLCARFLAAGAWLLAPLFLERPVNAKACLAGFTAVFLFLVVWVFYLGSFPTAYSETEHRLTSFKIVSEYSISLALALSGYFLWRKRKLFDPDVIKLVLASIGAGIASEMAFIYKAVIETGLTRPFSLLFRDLKTSEEALRKREAELEQINEQLEARVAERTAEARKRMLQLRALASELTEAEQRERRRLAQILHDHLQQLLVAARLHLSAECSRATDKQQGQGWARADELLQQAIALSRSLTVELCPPILNESGLPAALEWLGCWSLEKHRLTVDVVTDPAANPTSDTVRTFLFQAVRELLFNVVKHAGSAHARLVLKADVDQLHVLIEDDGCGFDVTTIESATHEGFGLHSIRERLEILGGSMTVESERGHGTSINLIAPLK
jgi:signal transduction histidine kinase